MSEAVTASMIDERLAPLRGVFVAARDDARLVVSHAGIFVLVGDVGGVVGASDGAAELAQATRASLSDHMMPTPLVETIVVSRMKPVHAIESLVVFLYLLDDLVTTGQRLDDFGVERIVGLVTAGSVAPGWRSLAKSADDHAPYAA